MGILWAGGNSNHGQDGALMTCQICPTLTVHVRRAVWVNKRVVAAKVDVDGLLSQQLPNVCIVDVLQHGRSTIRGGVGMTCGNDLQLIRGEYG